MFKLKLLTVALIISSCATKEKKENSRVSVDLSESEKTSISQYVDSFEYILINYADSLPIVEPYRIEFYNELIFIEDGSLNNLFIVEKSGEIITVIKSKGSGPGEFQYIDDFQVSENKIIIKDTQLNKFMTYDFNGNLLQEESAKNKALNFYKSEEYMLHFFNNRLNPGEFNFLRESLIGEKDEFYYLAKSGYEYKKVMSLENSFMKDFYDSQLILNIPFSYDIAFFNLDGRIKEIKTFDFGKNGLKDAERLNYSNGSFVDNSNNQDSEFVESVNQFFPLKNTYYMFLLNGIKEKHLIIFDRNFKIKNQHDIIENDIDGMPISNFPRWNTKNQLIQKRLSSFLLNDYLENEKEIRSKFPNSKIHEFIAKNRYKLERDWLVLVFWNMKDS